MCVILWYHFTAKPKGRKQVNKESPFPKGMTYVLDDIRAINGNGCAEANMITHWSSTRQKYISKLWSSVSFWRKIQDFLLPLEFCISLLKFEGSFIWKLPKRRAAEKGHLGVLSALTCSLQVSECLHWWGQMCLACHNTSHSFQVQ